jgi:hypothetical protein
VDNLLDHSMDRSGRTPCSRHACVDSAHTHASESIRELDARIEDLRAMRDTLAYLARHCSGDERPDCPILEGLHDARTPAGRRFTRIAAFCRLALQTLRVQTLP